MSSAPASRNRGSLKNAQKVKRPSLDRIENAAVLRFVHKHVILSIYLSPFLSRGVRSFQFVQIAGRGSWVSWGFGLLCDDEKRGFCHIDCHSQLAVYASNLEYPQPLFVNYPSKFNINNRNFFNNSFSLFSLSQFFFILISPFSS